MEGRMRTSFPRAGGPLPSTLEWAVENLSPFIPPPEFACKAYGNGLPHWTTGSVKTLYRRSIKGFQACPY